MGIIPTDFFESENVKFIMFMGVIVGIFVGILEGINIIFSWSIDPALKYSLCLLFLFILGFGALYIQNRILAKSIKDLRAEYNALIPK